MVFVEEICESFIDPVLLFEELDTYLTGLSEHFGVVIVFEGISEVFFKLVHECFIVREFVENVLGEECCP